MALALLVVSPIPLLKTAALGPWADTAVTVLGFAMLALLVAAVSTAFGVRMPAILLPRWLREQRAQARRGALPPEDAA